MDELTNVLFYLMIHNKNIICKISHLDSSAPLHTVSISLTIPLQTTSV